MAKILLVEDDLEVCEVVSDWLTDEHYTIDVVNSGSEAIERLRFDKYDVLIFDWQLPDLTGIEICKRFRSKGGNTPVLMLTGKAEITDKETGLDAGADDYLTKPFHPRELSARVRALLRRSGELKPNVLTCGDIELDPQAFKVTKGGKEITLLPKEFALLEFFLRHPNQVFSPEALLDRVWSAESEASPDTIRVHITKLRGKIETEGQPSPIKTIHRQGYKWEMQA
ncbi:MAG: response regulator transcription factor [Candidatus Obscuribacterales bacterium]|nr:response regulator transcription factor [Candidatus Obscuribacterales bacterium]